MILDAFNYQRRQLDDHIDNHTQSLVRGTPSRDEDQRVRGIIRGLQIARQCVDELENGSAKRKLPTNKPFLAGWLRPVLAGMPCKEEKMSETLRAGMYAIPHLESIEAPMDGDTDGENGIKAKVVPDLTGYKLLCVVPPAKDTFDGTGIIKADMVKSAEEQTSHVLFVLKVGPDAYKDTTKFPTGAWCKEGDFVITRAYAGTRFKVFGREFRLINDDAVDAVIEDPRGITRS